MIFFVYKSFCCQFADIGRERRIIAVVGFSGAAGNDQNHVLDIGAKLVRVQKTSDQSRRSALHE
jgi:hypothetical protein